MSAPEIKQNPQPAPKYLSVPDEKELNKRPGPAVNPMFLFGLGAAAVVGGSILFRNPRAAQKFFQTTKKMFPKLEIPKIVLPKASEIKQKCPQLIQNNWNATLRLGGVGISTGLGLALEANQLKEGQCEPIFASNALTLRNSQEVNDLEMLLEHMGEKDKENLDELIQLVEAFGAAKGLSEKKIKATVDLVTQNYLDTVQTGQLMKERVEEFVQKLDNHSSNDSSGKLGVKGWTKETISKLTSTLSSMGTGVLMGNYLGPKLAILYGLPLGLPQRLVGHAIVGALSYLIQSGIEKKMSQNLSHKDKEEFINRVAEELNISSIQLEEAEGELLESLTGAFIAGMSQSISQVLVVGELKQGLLGSGLSGGVSQMALPSSPSQEDLDQIIQTFLKPNLQEKITQMTSELQLLDSEVEEKNEKVLAKAFGINRKTMEEFVKNPPKPEAKGLVQWVKEHMGHRFSS